MPNPEQLADRLHSSAIHLLRRLRRTDPQMGVTAAQLSALSVLMGGPLTLTRLAAAEQVQVPTMSRLVSSMEDAGLVARERDTADARVVWVSQTAHGSSVLDRGREMRINALARQIQTLSASEQRTLVAAMDIVDSLLEGL